MSSRRSWLAAGGALTVVVAALAVILVFGQLTYPSLASLPDPGWGEPAGTIAFTRGNRGETCLYVVAASGGEPRQLRCGADWNSWPEWTDEGELTITSYGSVARRLTIDPGTGEIIDSTPEDGRHLPPSFDPVEEAGRPTIVTGGNEGLVRLSLVQPGSPERVILEIEGPRDYGIWQTVWSPDGRWILATDSAERVFIVDPEGGGARLLAEDAMGAAWHQPPG